MKQIFIVAVLLVYAYAGFAQNADAICGVWWNDEKTTKIRVEKKEGKYTGTIVYMIPEKYVDGKPPVDDKNPDPALQNRPLVGLQILSGFVYNPGKKEWANGKIYDPKSGKTYDCYSWLEGDVLKLKGYVAGIRWLGRSSEWFKTTF
jgi:uncharacterized protein (DUF2147 family)